MAFQGRPIRRWAIGQARSAFPDASRTCVPSARVWGSWYAFSTRAKRNRDELGLHIPFEHNKQTISKAGPRSIHERHQKQQSRPEHREATISIKQAARARDWDSAWDHWKNVENPDPLVFNAILHAADQCNKYHEAFQIHQDMCLAKLPRSAVTFSPLIRLAGRLRKLEQAKELVAEMREAGIEVNSHIYSALIEAHKFSKDSHGALDVWRQMQEAGTPMSATILCTIMGAVAQSGNVDGTEALLREAPKNVEPNIAHYNCMLLACRQAGNIDAARRFFQELRERDLKPDVIAYTSLLGTLRNVGRSAAEIDMVLSEMTKDGVAPDSFCMEERLACVLRVPVGSDLRTTSLEDQTRKVLESLSEVLQEAHTASVSLSNYSLQLEARLKPLLEIVQPAPTQSDWVRVVSPMLNAQAQSGTPAEYYWDRSSGRTQWELPPGPVTATVTAAL